MPSVFPNEVIDLSVSPPHRVVDYPLLTSPIKEEETHEREPAPALGRLVRCATTTRYPYHEERPKHYNRNYYNGVFMSFSRNSILKSSKEASDIVASCHKMLRRFSDFKTMKTEENERLGGLSNRNLWRSNCLRFQVNFYNYSS
jgi:hypothetical protein